jgi:hypothetical protein
MLSRQFSKSYSCRVFTLWVKAVEIHPTKFLLSLPEGHTATCGTSPWWADLKTPSQVGRPVSVSTVPVISLRLLHHNYAGMIDRTGDVGFLEAQVSALSALAVFMFVTGLWCRYTKAPTPTPTPRFLKLRLQHRLLHKNSLCINNGKPITHFITTAWIIRLLLRLATYI